MMIYFQWVSLLIFLVKHVVRIITFLNYVSVPLIENQILVNRLNISLSKLTDNHKIKSPGVMTPVYYNQGVINYLKYYFASFGRKS